MCGEGDFSFARAMIGSADRDGIFETKSMRVTATSYEPVEEIEKVWGGAENLRALRSVEGVELLAGSLVRCVWILTVAGRQREAGRRRQSTGS